MPLTPLMKFFLLTIMKRHILMMDTKMEESEPEKGREGERAMITRTETGRLLESKQERGREREREMITRIQNGRLKETEKERKWERKGRKREKITKKWERKRKREKISS